MKGTIRVDHINKNILISKVFARASMVIESEEYKKLCAVRSDYPEYSIIQREIRKNPQKESYRGLTYAYMEHYILTHDKSGEVMKLYEEMRLRALCHSIRYAHIKKWFLEIYPEIDDFSCKKIGESVTLPLAS
jgi:hypothetical protein